MAASDETESEFIEDVVPISPGVDNIDNSELQAKVVHHVLLDNLEVKHNVIGYSVCV